MVAENLAKKQLNNPDFGKRTTYPKMWALGPVKAARKARYLKADHLDDSRKRETYTPNKSKKKPSSTPKKTKNKTIPPKKNNQNSPTHLFSRAKSSLRRLSLRRLRRRFLRSCLRSSKDSPRTSRWSTRMRPRMRMRMRRERMEREKRFGWDLVGLGPTKSLLRANNSTDCLKRNRPRPSNRCFLEAFDYIKTTRKHLLEGAGRRTLISLFPETCELLVCF